MREVIVRRGPMMRPPVVIAGRRPNPALEIAETALVVGAISSRNQKKKAAAQQQAYQAEQTAYQQQQIAYQQQVIAAQQAALATSGGAANVQTAGVTQGVPLVVCFFITFSFVLMICFQRYCLWLEKHETIKRT